MSRPEHLSVPNTPEGIRRINERQEHYDKDPEGYERKKQEEKERIQQEESDAEYQFYHDQRGDNV